MTNTKLPPHLEARRAAIAAEVRQMVADAEHWNSTHPNEEPIVVDPDLTKDVEAEVARRAAGPHYIDIIMNGQARSVLGPTLSYENAVVLVFSNASAHKALTVVYRHGPTDQPEGSLTSGQSVAVVPGMVFNVADTSRA